MCPHRVFHPEMTMEKVTLNGIGLFICLDTQQWPREDPGCVVRLFAMRGAKLHSRSCISPPSGGGKN